MTEDKEKSKLQSRKFLVWFVWLIITIAILVFSVIVMVVTHSVNDSTSGLIEKTLEWFFYTSIVYLGANVSQKIGYAISDALSSKEGESESESN